MKTSMTEKERQDFIEILENLRLKLSKDKEAARKFLVDAGIYTAKGNLRKPYKSLCIPHAQD